MVPSLQSKDVEIQRHVCEVRFVASLPKNRIRSYLELVQQRRTFDAYYKLRSDVEKEVGVL